MNMVARAYVASYLDQNNVLLNGLHYLDHRLFKCIRYDDRKKEKD